MPLDANTRLTNDTLVPASRINPGIPNYVSNVLSHAMAVNGEDRIQTINDFVTQLFDRHYQLEHQKGATQTIPIQRINEAAEQNYQQKKKAPQKSSTSSAAVVIAVIVIFVFLGVGAYMLYQLLLPPDKSQGVESSVGTNNSVYVADSASDVIPYEPVITSASQAASEDESPLGTGAFMPNVIGVRYETVVSQLGKSFTIRADYFYSDATEKGIVTEQSIPENTEYDPARKNELVLKVCKGTENVAVPEYSGRKYTDYSALLDSLDIKYKKVDVYSDSVAIGYVVSTDIGVGYNVNVKNGEVLTVRVSKGKTVKTTTDKKDDKKEEVTKAE